MSESPEHFPTPADDASDDVFVSPQDDLPPGQLGASPLDTAARVRKPKRMRALLVLLAGALTIILVMVFASKRSVTPAPVAPGTVNPNGMVVAPVTTRPVNVDSLTMAKPTSSSASSSTLDPLEVVNAGRGDMPTPPMSGPQASGAPPGSPPVVYDPTGNSARPDPTGAPQGVAPGAASDPFGAVLPPATPPGSFQGRNGESVLPGAQDEAGAAEQRLRLKAQEHAAKEAALIEYRKTEEARLKANTLIAENSSLARPGASGVPSRFGAPSTAGSMGGAQAGAGLAGTGTATDILPGTRVEAMTVSEFIGDIEGGGQVEVRLTAPLRSRGHLILPAGTRGFGTASGGTPRPGQPARVTLTVSVFVTPQGDVIRNLSAKGLDPRTLAFSIPAKAMNRYPQRIVRGVLATSVDLALTNGQTQRPSAFEQPSLRDQALNDARRRLGALIGGPIGDENSQPATVTLPANTMIVLSFGN